MSIALGSLFLVAGIALFVFAPRMVRANEASSGVLFGRADPYRKFPRFTRAWSLVITRLVAAAFVVAGFMALVGVVSLD